MEFTERELWEAKLIVSRADHSFDKNVWVVGSKDVSSVLPKLKTAGDAAAKKEGRGYVARVDKLEWIGTIDVF